MQYKDKVYKRQEIIAQRRLLNPVEGQTEAFSCSHPEIVNSPGSSLDDDVRMSTCQGSLLIKEWPFEESRKASS